ncbi:TRAP transporter small permease [Agaribacter flavus]|uniref:TRAP transporter small permease protein n=1 Tax=Agaribacter flavus TaxID=1902781 RepID=A0ABV7FUS1_9ALTE
MHASKPSSDKVTDDINWDDPKDEQLDFSSIGLEDWLSLLLFFTLALVLVAQVLSRYVLNAPLGWTEEVARYQLVVLAFVGASIGFRKNTHISFVYFQRFIPQVLKSTVMSILSLINTVFLAFLLYTCVKIMPLLSSHEMSSLAFSISALYGLVGLALLACLLRSSMHTITSFKHAAKPHLPN